MLLKWDHLIPVPFLTAATGWLGPYLNVLPLITVFLFILQQKLFMPPPTDEQSAMQQKIMMFLPIVFTFLFVSFPAGLVIYWTVNNMLTISQQYYIYKVLD